MKRCLCLSVVRREGGNERKEQVCEKGGRQGPEGLGVRLAYPQLARHWRIRTGGVPRTEDNFLNTLYHGQVEKGLGWFSVCLGWRGRAISESRLQELRWHWCFPQKADDKITSRSIMSLWYMLYPTWGCKQLKAFRTTKNSPYRKSLAEHHTLK